MNKHNEDFNENPFKKGTPVIPFSNGTEAMIWKDRNCDKCINYESESKEEKDAKCKAAFHLDYGFISGTLPLHVAKDIGCEYNPLYGFVKLLDCRMFNDGEKPF